MTPGSIRQTRVLSTRRQLTESGWKAERLVSLIPGLLKFGLGVKVQWP